MRHPFGWDLPPGCTQRMIDEQCEGGPCDVCGQHVDNCVCPECPVCHNVGDPNCYDEHGMVRTTDQLESRRMIDEAEAREARQWEEYAKEFSEPSKQKG